MTAFQEGFPDLTVFLTFGHSLLWKQSEHGKKPLAECRYGLLVPFLDGMIEAARGQTRIVDGHELSYGYRDAEAFARGLPGDQAATPPPWPPTGRPISACVSAGFGLWLDYDWRKQGWNTGDLEKNYFSPERFETSLRAAHRAIGRVCLDLYGEAAMVVAGGEVASTCRRPTSRPSGAYGVP